MITCDTLLCFSMICSSTVVVFASNKGTINYLKVIVSNKKVEKPVQISPIKSVVDTNLAVMADQETPTRMPFRDVYMYEVTEKNGNNYMTTEGLESNQLMENYDKGIVGNDKKVTRLPADDTLGQRMSLDITSTVHQKISKQSISAAVVGTTASGTTAYRKSEQQQKKQQQQKQHQQHKQEQQQQKKQQQQHKQELQQQKKQQQQQQHKQELQQQKRQQKPQKRRRTSYHKVSPRPVYHKERKESVGIVTIGPDDSYNDQSVTQDISRTDYPTHIGVVEEDVDDNRQDEDADQSSKVWEVNMVDDQVMINSAKSQEQRSKASSAVAAAAATTISADVYDDGNQTS